MPRKKKTKVKIAPNTAGTLDDVIKSNDVTFSDHSIDDNTHRITKEVAQSKLEHYNDWKSGMDAFRERATLELTEIPLLRDYIHRNVESLVQKVLILEKKVEQLEE
jgi:phytoene/squalene synthetase